MRVSCSGSRAFGGAPEPEAGFVCWGSMEGWSKCCRVSRGPLCCGATPAQCCGSSTWLANWVSRGAGTHLTGKAYVARTSPPLHRSQATSSLCPPAPRPGDGRQPDYGAGTQPPWRTTHLPNSRPPHTHLPTFFTPFHHTCLLPRPRPPDPETAASPTTARRAGCWRRRAQHWRRCRWGPAFRRLRENGVAVVGRPLGKAEAGWP